jgi:hypothetical protein
MTSSAVPTTDRSEFRHILASGTRVGALTSVAVVVFILVSRLIPMAPMSMGVAREMAQTLIVLVTAISASLLPAFWVGARSADGIAGAAAVGLWGTVVFMAINIVVLRPLHAYPWTWDAIGGGSNWWYLPIWWMLGTFLAWMGGLHTATRAARGTTSLSSLAAPVVIGALVLAGIAAVAHLPVRFHVLAGAGYVVTLAGLAIVSHARQAA